MILTRAIIEEARGWIGCKTDKKGSYRSECIDELNKLYNGKISNDHWCAVFVWTITEVACQKLRIPNPLHKTKATRTMLAEARKTLRVDKDPGVGSVFFNVRDAGGHVGFVTKISEPYFHTIEGNTSDSSGLSGVYEKTNHDLRNTAKKYEFIHLEDLDTFENNALALLTGFGESIESFGMGKILLIVASLGVGGYFLNKKKIVEL